MLSFCHRGRGRHTSQLSKLRYGPAFYDSQLALNKKKEKLFFRDSASLFMSLLHAAAAAAAAALSSCVPRRAEVA